jgi:hypothetical protein
MQTHADGVATGVGIDLISLGMRAIGKLFAEDA